MSAVERIVYTLTAEYKETSAVQILTGNPACLSVQFKKRLGIHFLH